MPRCTSRRAMTGWSFASEASRATTTGSDARRSQRTSVLVVFVVLVDDEAAHAFGGIEQALVAFVPIGGDLVEEHHALVRPAELDEAGLADERLQVLRLFDVVV